MNSNGHFSNMLAGCGLLENVRRDGVQVWCCTFAIVVHIVAGRGWESKRGGGRGGWVYFFGLGGVLAKVGGLSRVGDGVLYVCGL